MAQMCFKIGKYLLERNEYKNAMIRLAFNNMKPDDTVTLIVSFGKSGYDKENMKFIDITKKNHFFSQSNHYFLNHKINHF